MSSFLITRPDCDPATHYLFEWSKEVLDFAEKRDVKVLNLSGEKANKMEFESIIRKFSPKLVMFNGHGAEDLVTGHKNSVIVKVGENENLLKNKIVYALSCRSAKILGPKSVESGALNYTGFEDDFIFMYEPELFSRPLKDKTAELFLSPSNGFINSLLKGHNVSDSFERARVIMRTNFQKSISSSEVDPSTARYLWWNLRNFKSHGDMSVSI